MENPNNDQIQEAIQMIIEATEIIKNTVNGTRKQSHFEAYGAYGLDQALGNGNPNDSSLFDLLED